MATSGQMELYFGTFLCLNTYILPSGNLKSKTAVDIPQVNVRHVCKRNGNTKLTRIGL